MATEAEIDAGMEALEDALPFQLADRNDLAWIAEAVIDAANDSLYTRNKIVVEESFEGLIGVARQLLNRHYPKDLISESPVDPGTIFVKHLHAALDAVSLAEPEAKPINPEDAEVL